MFPTCEWSAIGAAALKIDALFVVMFMAPMYRYVLPDRFSSLSLVTCD
jgi:hypothetical protein